MKIAVIEWPSDAGESPNVYAADTIDELLPPILEAMEGVADDAFGDDFDLEEFPRPDKHDLPAVKRWLLDMREETTGVWLNLYDVAPDQVGASSLPLRPELMEPHALVTRPRLAENYCDDCHAHRDYRPGLHVGPDIHKTNEEI